MEVQAREIEGGEKNKPINLTRNVKITVPQTLAKKKTPLSSFILITQEKKKTNFARQLIKKMQQKKKEEKPLT